VKPFIEALQVTNPVRQSRASSRKRVLRGERRLSLRSVDSEIKRCVIEPRNVTRVSSLRHFPERGPSLALATPGPTGVPSHTGVGGIWRMITRVSRELGRSWQFPEEDRIGSNRYSKLRDDPSAVRLWPNGDETQTLQGIAKRRKRSAARRLSGSRSVS
jgi:hypothetical protein